jgi:S1-C subfamily serine protease
MSKHARCIQGEEKGRRASQSTTAALTYSVSECRCLHTAKSHTHSTTHIMLSTLLVRRVSQRMIQGKHKISAIFHSHMPSYAGINTIGPLTNAQHVFVSTANKTTSSLTCLSRRPLHLQTQYHNHQHDNNYNFHNHTSFHNTKTMLSCAAVVSLICGGVVVASVSEAEAQPNVSMPTSESSSASEPEPYTAKFDLVTTTVINTHLYQSNRPNFSVNAERIDPAAAETGDPWSDSYQEILAASEANGPPARDGTAPIPNTQTWCSSSGGLRAAVPATVIVFVVDKSGRESEQVLCTSSGFFVHQGGLVITNAHAVPRDLVAMGRVRVHLNDGSQYSAKIRCVDPSSDLALLELTDTKERTFPTAILADSDTVEQGMPGIAVGSPGLLYFSSAAGIVSATRRDPKLVGRPAHVMSLIQTDAAIKSGFSGGPFVDWCGQVVGVNALGVTQSHTSEADFHQLTDYDPTPHGMLIPSNAVRVFLRKCIRYNGRCPLFRFALSVASVDGKWHQDEQLRENPARNLPDRATVVTVVDKKGPAGQAGVRTGDLILEVEGIPVGSSRELVDRLLQVDESRPVKLHVRRDHADMNIEVTPSVIMR